MHIVVEANKKRISCRVCDWGTTIPESDYNRIFTRQYQIEKSAGRGLGLAIVKRIAQAHNATVGVKPNRPQGNCFYIEFPKG